MSVTGGHHMNDDNELSDVRESLVAEGAGLAGVHMHRPAEEVMARGRTLRLRRRLLRGLSGVTAASAAMALALALPLGGAGARQVHVNETDWSVNTNQDGTVTLQVRKAADPARLETVLSQAGVPAVVNWNESCWASVRPKPVKGVAYLPLPRVARTVHSRGWVAGGWTVKFQPAQRPTNLSYFLGSRTGKAGHGGIWSMIVTVVPTTLHLGCAKGPHAISSPHAAATGSPHPTATACPSASPSPYGTPSPSGTPGPYESPSPRVTPASSPAAG
jgi:hypothetical protein